ncbi:hypothetical protein SAMN04488128_106464 [Chitinophaga eiseniae]|uniref:Uncharacterized protein n=1 Tax=Chitinophaga eiseniae TaxID=634771 RepID=A0A1T4TW58_9BACT|nr:hypothetical protein [Chitinophaga eiseniae]SKA44685.1 hypothetical protein SAMN04488128_106464 [Chitinophaga eiseniae]
MDQQYSIFDKSFDSPEWLRRRDLMPAWLKVYTWVTFGLSLFMTVLVFLQIPDASGKLAGADAAGFWAGTLFAAALIAAVFLLPAILVLLEIKWAIWFNLVLGVLWIVLISSVAIFSDPAFLYVGITMFFYIPFWAGLLPLRRRWATEAVSGRARRRKNRAAIS